MSIVATATIPDTAGTITYAFTITNTGNVTVTGITVEQAFAASVW